MSPQDVQPGRNRAPLIIGLAVVLVLLAGAIAAWLVLRDNGESTRAQYCTAIKTLAPNNDLASAVASADATTLDQARKLAGLAPGAVAKDWQTLSDILASVQNSQTTPDLATGLKLYGALKNILQDSNDNCGTAYTLPTP